MDLHFQSLSSWRGLLETNLPPLLRAFEEVWVLTGSGHHVAAGHQSSGGVLEQAVGEWLGGWVAKGGGRAMQGRDGAGNGGAFLVVSARLN
jgi:hypothetical protein